MVSVDIAITDAKYLGLLVSRHKPSAAVLFTPVVSLTSLECRYMARGLVAVKVGL